MDSTNSSLFCIKFIDFSTAFAIQKNSDGEVISSKLRTRLNQIWISPEQTGRISKKVDYRTDFYSLGLVFYWLLCGDPPFKEEGGDLYYSHIAKVIFLL
jgi:two-component system sensor histidine kinase/response regulator